MSVLVIISGVAALIALTAGTAFFVAAEFSLAALDRGTVDAAAKDGDSTAAAVQKAHRQLSFQLSGAQVGITLTTLITGFLAEPLLATFLTPMLSSLDLSGQGLKILTTAISLTLATLLSMIIGELVPKNLAIAAPMATARKTARLHMGFSSLFRWLIQSLDRASNKIVRAMGLTPIDEGHHARSAAELSALVGYSAQDGSIDARTAGILERSFQFTERSAEDLMRPRSTVVSLSADDTVADLIAIASETGYSRFPVTLTDLDDTQGIVHVKQALTVKSTARHTTKLSLLARPVGRVPLSLGGDAVLQQIRADGSQILLVIDEYGGVAGLVTFEDVIEEIFGDVSDEYDSDTTIDIRRVEGGWECSGLVRMDELETEIGYRASPGDYETLAGLVISQLGRLARPSDTVQLPSPGGPLAELATPSLTATVLSMDGRRVDKILVSSPNSVGDATS